MKAQLLISGQSRMPDADELADFVRVNARGGVLYRGSGDFERALEEGIIVAIVGNSETGDPNPLWAVAGVFPLADDFYELGGALVRPDRTGFGLQAPMISARLLTYVKREGTNRLDRLFSGAAYAEYGWGSRQVLQGAGFEPVAFASTPAEMRVDCPRCKRDIPIGAQCCYQFYRAGSRCADVDYAPGPSLRTRRRDGLVLSLDLPEI